MRDVLPDEMKILTKHLLYSVWCMAMATTALFASDGNAQVRSVKDHVIKLENDNYSIAGLIETIEEQSNYEFVYLHDQLVNNATIQFDEGPYTVANVLLAVAKEADYEFKQVNKAISMLKQPATEKAKEEIIVELNADVTVTGKVTSDDGETVPGATVLIKGTSKGTVTDAEGNYTIEAPEDGVLVISFVGYKTMEVGIAGRTTVDVSLATDFQQLEEVVVVGYGTRKKSHNTGAIAQVGGEDVAAIQANRVDDALAGKLSGVLIQNQSGEPGADPKIQIRASSSITGNSSPLIVVDGYPISGNLSTVNPNDIESLEVLKDAASAAIYGSRGANGVIMVTTKKGRSGKANFSYNAFTSFSSKYRRENILPTASEWADIVETNIDNGTWNTSEVDQTLLDFRLDAYRESPDVEAREDWLFQGGRTTNHDFSVSGGNESVSVFASVGYLNTEGVVLTQAFERINGRLNIDAKLGDKFKTGLSVNGSVTDRDILAHDMRDLLRAYNISPLYHTEASIAFVQQLDQEAQELDYDPFDDGFGGEDEGRSASPMNESIYTLQPGDYAHDWHYGRDGNGIGGSSNQGSAAKLFERDQWEKNYFANVSSYLQYSIIEGLNIKTVLGADLRDQEQYFHQLSQADRRGQISRTVLSEINTKRSSILSENTLNYVRIIGKHDIAAVAGFEVQNNYITAINLAGGNLPSDEPLNFALLDPEDVAIAERDETIVRKSVFGRINYAYDDRYLFSASLRRDGDSRFGANNRYATFPALSIGWNVHNESFYNVNFMNLLKLRFSTGSLGTTSNLGAFNSLSLLNPSVSVFGNSYLIPNDVANPDLTWQTNTESNYGIDFGFVDNRFKLGIDYYTSDIEDILIDQTVSETYGTPSVRINSGDVKSSGLEIELSAVVMEKSDFTWNVSANLSTVNTEITDLGNIEELNRSIFGISGRGPVFRNYVGGELSEMWGLETIGEVEAEFVSDLTFPIGGIIRDVYVKDQQAPGEEGHGEIDATRPVSEGGDLVKIGQNTPDFYWGMSSSVGYKDFDISLQLQGAQGGEVYNIDPLYYGSPWQGGVIDSFDADEDGIADHNGLHFTRKRDQTDAVLQDASYVALRNLTVGYTLKPDWVNKVGLSSVRVYAAGTNLLYLWAKDYTSFNPEGVLTTNGPTTVGVNLGASPVVRSFTLGLNVNF